MRARKALTKKDVLWARKLIGNRKLSDIEIILKIWNRAYLRALKNIGKK
jgi:pyruvate kinase